MDMSVLSARERGGSACCNQVLLLTLLLATIPVEPLSAASDYDAAWLRYSRIDDKTVRESYGGIPAVVVALGDSPVVRSAQGEVVRGVRGMLGRTLRTDATLPEENAIVLGTYDVVSQVLPAVGRLARLNDDGYWLSSVEVNGTKHLVVTAPNDRGVLYGSFALLRRFALGQPIVDLNEQQSPQIGLRLVTHFDRLNGEVNRHDAEGSIFWDGGKFAADADRMRGYARLLASIGVNSVSLNDPRDGPALVIGEGTVELAAAADVLRPFGLRTFVAIGPRELRELIGAGEAGEIDESAADTLTKRMEEIYTSVPDLGGILLSHEVSVLPSVASGENKAPTDEVEGDAREAPSESDASAGAGGMPNADTSHAHATRDARSIINAAAAAIAPHGGTVIYRFVRSPRITVNSDAPLVDPAVVLTNALGALDGQLAENVILDIPARPVAANVRQPPSPLLGVLSEARRAIELDFTQQLLGRQRHLCFLVPSWKATLDFDLKIGDKPSPVKLLIKSGGLDAESRDPNTSDKPEAASEESFEDTGARSSTLGSPPSAAFIGVANVSRDPNWLRSPLAMANLFGFGQLAWNPDLASKAIAEEWTRLTFGHDPLVVGTVVEILLESGQVYESYTGPLGLGTLTNVAERGYGPDVGSLVNAEGFRLRANEAGVGADRTIASGSGLLGQYRPEVARLVESPETCPQDIILFLHHLPYKHRLKSGKTVIQQIYNSLYAGAEGAARTAMKWRSLEGKIDDGRFGDIQALLDYQAGHAEAWRDALANWFLRMSGIADDEGRVGNYPNRIEAESMQLEGYEAKNVMPWETASGGQCAVNTAPTGNGALAFTYEGEAGWVDVSIRYFDEIDGASSFELLVAGEVVDRWKTDDKLPGNEPNGATTTRHITRSIALRKGDEIRLQGSADGTERAAVDYIEIRVVKP